jgi:predicted transglutaminase-like cysteine proteinase
MARHPQSIFLAIIACVFSADSAEARSPQVPSVLTPIAEATPTLAPFQHVRFCIRYPADCKSNPAEKERIDLTAETLELLKRVNHSVNVSIAPTPKNYGTDLHDGWTISPTAGDCNDYAVTKRHELLGSGLPSKALRLSVVKTSSGLGHLVLIVVTTRGDIVMDNLTEAISPWQSTGYHWLKIQSAADSRFWYEIKAPVAGPSMSEADLTVRLAGR